MAEQQDHLPSLNRFLAKQNIADVLLSLHKNTHNHFIKSLRESSFSLKLLCLWVPCQGSGVRDGSPAPFLWLPGTSLRREQMSLVIWPGSLGCCIPTLTLNPLIFFFFFLQQTANLFAVTKHRLSRGWFHWEALPDMRGALMWLTHTRYCCLIEGLRGSCHSVFFSIGMISR